MYYRCYFAYRCYFIINLMLRTDNCVIIELFKTVFYVLMNTRLFTGLSRNNNGDDDDNNNNDNNKNKIIII